MNLDPSDETHPDNCDSKDQHRLRAIFVTCAAILAWLVAWTSGWCIGA